ncbi:hypothetical protein U1Q18_032446 [Sarracenia purpurea var. burkii]
MEANYMAEIREATKALFELIKEPICPTTTKALLTIIYHMVSLSSPANEKVIARSVEMGMVSLLLETLVDSDRRMSERALRVLDGLFAVEEGRENRIEICSPNLVNHQVLVESMDCQLAHIGLYASQDRTEDCDFWRCADRVYGRHNGSLGCRLPASVHWRVKNFFSQFPLIKGSKEVKRLKFDCQAYGS